MSRSRAAHGAPSGPEPAKRTWTILKNRTCSVLLALAWAPALLAQDSHDISAQAFQNPPFEFRPIPSIGAGGTGPGLPLSVTGELKTVYLDRGFGGLLVAPTAVPPPRSNTGGTFVGSGPRRPIGLQSENAPEASPWIPVAAPGEAGLGSYVFSIGGTSGAPASAAASSSVPPYLSKEYFDLLRQVLDYSKENGRKIIFYDEVGFPSGIANHTTPPKYYRKLLERTEEQITGPAEYHGVIPADGVLMAAVSMNRNTLARVDLTPLVKDGAIDWKAPAGPWRVLIFRCVAGKSTGGVGDYNGATDYLDPDAVRWFINTVYERHAREVGSYFGNTIFMSFFDDVGIYSDERTWTAKFNERFRERIGRDPAIYYPALWDDIGAETEAARVAFFDTRAEMLADGFPRLVSEWGAAHNLPVSGHCPGNYEVQPVDMNGDPFKFYRAQPIPMVDVIFGRGFGRDGYKLISSAADLYDKPVVAAESFNNTGTTIGCGKMMELFVRGINRFVTGTNTSKDIGGPTAFAEWAGRTSLLLQGGRRVSDIAIFYPIAALEAFYHFDAAGYPTTMRSGTYVPWETDYLAVGEMLMNQLHRDFTFVHPDVFASDRIRIEGKTLRLENPMNWQSFKVLILPGERVIPLQALKKIKAYYDAGGAVIATSRLPSRASQLGSDAQMRADDGQVQAIMNAMFGPDGKGIFIPKPDPEALARAFEKLGVVPDVAFAGNPQPTAGNGFFSYIHKIKEGKNVYFFANSSAEAVDTRAELRGRVKPELWNPHTGATSPVGGVSYVEKAREPFTTFPLKLSPVASVFVVAAEDARPPVN